MTDNLQNVDTFDISRLPLPGQAYPRPAFTRVSRVVPEIRDGEAPPKTSIEPPLFNDLVSGALRDYQAVHLIVDGDRTYMPYAFDIREGETLTSAAGAQHVVTKVWQNASGGPYWNPYYSQMCGMLLTLDPVPAWDAILSLPEPARLFLTAAFPDQEVVDFLQRRNLVHAQGFAMRVNGSEPFAGDNGISERNGLRRADTGIRVPGAPHLFYEMTQFRELTHYEFMVFASKAWVADQLLRYLHAILRTYRDSFRSCGLEDLLFVRRGQDEHMAHSADKWPLQSDLHVRKVYWDVPTSEVYFDIKRVIDRLVFSVSVNTGRGTTSSVPGPEHHVWDLNDPGPAKHPA
jgi:hypothetical protein